ncbi:MAG: helix-turn-helix domain-containing protein [Marinirhabdus sp.]|nr:helix-turn-helix domain-containing protein [Marinirhabdus sp.]
MEIQTPEPHSALKDIIKEYYYIQMDWNGEAKHLPIVDDCCNDFVVFKEADALFTYGEEQTTVPISSKVFTVLNATLPYQLSFKESLTFFTIKCHPWMNRYFFSEVNGSVVLNLETYHPELLSIHSKMLHNGAVEDMAKMADDFVRDKNVELTNAMVFVKSVCEYITEKKGRVKVSEISEHFGKSRQYINKVFTAEVMYSLKVFIVSVRIINLIKHKAKHKSAALTSLCYEYGYFDQAHFINDFKRVAGVTPTQYFNSLPEFILRHN